MDNMPILQLKLKRSVLKLKLKNYFYNYWNIFDVITLSTYLVGLVLRCIPVDVCDRCFYAARIILAFNYVMFLFRILRMFSVLSRLGPKLVMIAEMVSN